MGRFNEQEAEDLLVQCHRRCCVCHKFCGVKIELDHIEPRNEGGSDEIDNAIPLCFDCHAEVHHYNDRHPRGRKFSPRELREHRDQWLRICREQPASLLDAPRFQNPGPLESVLAELEFNALVASELDSNKLGCPFEVAQTQRAMATGALLTLPDAIRTALQTAYMRLMRANTFIVGLPHAQRPANAQTEAQKHAMQARDSIRRAIEALKGL